MVFKKQNISYDLISIATLIIKLQGSGWGLSMMTITYKLTNIAFKTKKVEKTSENKISIKFKAICHKITALSNFNCLTFLELYDIFQLFTTRYTLKTVKNSKLKNNLERTFEAFTK